MNLLPVRSRFSRSGSPVSPLVKTSPFFLLLLDMPPVPYISADQPPCLPHHLCHLATVPIAELADAAKFLNIKYVPILTLDLTSSHRYMHFDLDTDDPDTLICTITVNDLGTTKTPTDLAFSHFIIEAPFPCRRLLEPLMETLATLPHIPHTFAVPSANPLSLSPLSTEADTTTPLASKAAS